MILVTYAQRYEVLLFFGKSPEVEVEMWKLAFVITLFLVPGCKYSPVLWSATGNYPADRVISNAVYGEQGIIRAKIIRRLSLQKNENCTQHNPEVCSEAYRGLSDADLCKRYSSNNNEVLWERSRRKLNCSKQSDSPSSK